MAKCVFHNNVDRIPGAASATPASLTKLHIEYIRPERLCSSPNNARTHSKKQLKQIARSIERFGFVNPEAVDHTVLLRIQTGTDCFREIRMSGQNQNGFHQFLHRDQTLPKAQRHSNHSTTLAGRSMET